MLHAKHMQNMLTAPKSHAAAQIDFQASSQFDAAECQAASLSLHSSDLVYTSIYLTVEGDMDSVCICGESAGCAACAACAEAVRCAH